MERIHSNIGESFEKYLESNDFVPIHNDLHFDNIFFKDGKIKLIDFERSIKDWLFMISYIF